MNVGKCITVALVAAGCIVSCDAAIVRRGLRKMPDSVNTFCLESWGPKEETFKNCDVVFLDADLTSKERVSEVSKKGKLTVGYISAGTIEKWRADADEFKSSVKSIKYRGYGGSETWLDITEWQSLKGVMSNRIKEAAGKGFDFIEYDNIDCDINRCGNRNSGGLLMTGTIHYAVPGASFETLRKKQREYLEWLIAEARSNGMGVGLKNAQSHIPDVADDVAFAINEQCQQYDECDLYNNLLKGGKPVFGVEYNDNNGRVCSEAKKYGIITKYRSNGWHDCW